MPSRRTHREPASRHEPVTALDLVLLIGEFAGTPHAREILRQAHAEIAAGGDVGEWVRAVRTARDLGALGDDAAFYLMDILTEHVAQAWLDTDETLALYSAMMDEAEAREGLTEDESFRVDDAPPDWDAARRLWERRFDVLRAALYVRLREAGMAMVLLRDGEAYTDRSRAGWRALMALTAVDDPDLP